MESCVSGGEGYELAVLGFCVERFVGFFFFGEVGF